MSASELVFYKTSNKTLSCSAGTSSGIMSDVEGFM